MKHNNAIPFNIAIKCLFSLGKNVLKPKQPALSNEDFETLVFLKLRFQKHLFFVLSVRQRYFFWYNYPICWYFLAGLRKNYCFHFKWQHFEEYSKLRPLLSEHLRLLVLEWTDASACRSERKNV